MSNEELIDLPKKRIRLRDGDRDYVNNKELTIELDKYSKSCRAAIENGKEEPKMNSYLGASIMKMAERLSMSPGFRGYYFREEMVGNAILAAVKYAKNFDGDRFNNGFAYITQILFSHMVITIKNEKKKYKTNMELIQQAELMAFGDYELGHLADDHARAIADQKLTDMETQVDSEKKGGFTLRTGYNKEARAKMIGTPMVRDEQVETE